MTKVIHIPKDAWANFNPIAGQQYVNSVLADQYIKYEESSVASKWLKFVKQESKKELVKGSIEVNINGK